MDIKQQVRDEWEYFASDHERAIDEMADSLAPVYTNDIIREWSNLSGDDSDRWQEWGIDANDGYTIDRLMSIDLAIYYRAQVETAYLAVLDEKYGEAN